MPKRAPSPGDRFQWYTEQGSNLFCTVCNVQVSRGSVDEHEAGRRHRTSVSQAIKATQNVQPRPPQPAAANSRNPQQQQQPRGNPSHPGHHAPPAATASLVQKRQCGQCTLLNDPHLAACSMCGDARLRQMPVVMVTMGSEQTNCECPSCGANSPIDAPRCFICGHDMTRLGLTGAAAAAADDDDDDVVIEHHRVKRERHEQDEDEDEFDMCVICLSKPADHGFIPCGHIVMCADCAPNMNGARNCYTCRARVQKMVLMGKKPARSAAPHRTVSASQHAANVAHGTVASPGRNWQHVGSTFPWIGGERDAWPRFVREIEAAAAAYVKIELGSRYPQAHVKRCEWSPALQQRLKEGWCQHACPEGAWAGVFGWHGSKKGVPAIAAIAKNGWDPSTRSRNAHGAGDYFAVHHSQAVEYALSAGRAGKTQHGDVPMLLAFLLRGDHLKWVEDYCIICDNPAASAARLSFSFPMYTVHFTKQDPPDSWMVPRFPYRWQFGWEKDRTNNDDDDEDDGNEDWVTVQTKAGEYHPYDHRVNAMLNEAMCKHYAQRHGGGGDAHIVKYTTPRANPITHVPEHVSYQVDLSKMTQTNLETDFLRKINIECVPPAALPKTLWMMLRDAAEIDRADAAVTRGARRDRHDYAHNKSNAPDASGGNGSAEQQFWLVLDMFSQRALSAGYFRYHGQPCAVTGQMLPSRKQASARYQQVSVHGAVMRADFEAMLLQAMVWDQHAGVEVPRLPGWPLAVVNA